MGILLHLVGGARIGTGGSSRPRIRRPVTGSKPRQGKREAKSR